MKTQWSNEAPNNKLKIIKADVKKWDSSIQPRRQDEVILTRLRIGHTRLTHGYLMSTPHESKPRCNTCNTEITIAHLFNECKNYEQERIQHFGMKRMNDILGDRNDFSMIKIIQFLKKTNLYEEI